MSVCVQADEDSAAEEPGAPVRELYETKSVSKVVRVLTVVAYLLSVSLAAILLSVYYVCVWKSPELPPAVNETEGELNARRGGHADYDVHAMPVPHVNITGGSNTTVNTTDTLLTTNITSLPPPSEPSSPPTSPEAEPFTTPLNLETTVNETTTESSVT